MTKIFSLNKVFCLVEGSGEEVDSQYHLCELLRRKVETDEVGRIDKN